MKIAMALFRYFPYGGLQRDMSAIAAECIRRGHQVTVFCRSCDGELPPGVRVELLPNRAWTNHGADARFVRVLSRYTGEYDVLVGFNKMPGLDFYYAADGCIAERLSGFRTRLPRYRARLGMERAVFASPQTRILSISPPQKLLFQKHYGTAESRFVDLPPGIGRDRIVPENYKGLREASRRRLGISYQDRILLFIGSGFRTKGLDRAIRLLVGLPVDHHLFVVGRDNARAFETLAAKCGVSDRVHFLGGRDDVPEWLQAADILVHPAYAENTGTVLLEAAVAGLPVLTTPVCGYATWLEQYDMGLVRPEPSPADVQSLLAVSRETWVARARTMAAGADIFDLVRHAVDAIERKDQ